MKRATKEDIEDALDHMGQQEDQALALEDFRISPVVMLAIAELDKYDDLVSWLEIDDDELRGIDEQSRFDTLKKFRGSAWAEMAITWKRPEQIPPIIIVEGPTFTAIGDGRGRINYAIGMGWAAIPSVILTWVE